MESYFREIESRLKQQPGLTADRLANMMKVNSVLMKEQLKVSGFIVLKLIGS